MGAHNSFKEEAGSTPGRLAPELNLHRETGRTGQVIGDSKTRCFRNKKVAVGSSVI